MTPQEYAQIQKLPTSAPKVLTGQDLGNKTPRTLLWGYTTDRYSFHVYLDEHAVIHKVIYLYDDTLVLHLTESNIESNEGWVPSKRLYPEACDAEFCRLLIERGLQLPFTAYNETRELGHSFYGKKKAELAQPCRHCG